MKQDPFIKENEKKLRDYCKNLLPILLEKYGIDESEVGGFELEEDDRDTDN